MRHHIEHIASLEEGVFAVINIVESLKPGDGEGGKVADWRMIQSGPSFFFFGGAIVMVLPAVSMGTSKEAVLCAPCKENCLHGCAICGKTSSPIRAFFSPNTNPPSRPSSPPSDQLRYIFGHKTLKYWLHNESIPC